MTAHDEQVTHTPAVPAPKRKTKGDGSGRSKTIAQGRKRRVDVPRAVKDECVDFLEVIYSCNGRLTQADFESEARRLKVVWEAPYRWVNNRRRGMGKQPITRERFDAASIEIQAEVRAADGVLWLAWANLSLDEKISCSYSTFCRAFARLPQGDKAAARTGVSSALPFDTRQEIYEERPGVRVYGDLFQIPVAVRKRGDGKPLAAWLLTFVDGFSWRITAWAVFDHVPNAQDVNATYAKMLIPNDIDGQLIGGSANQFKPDNGGQLVAEEADLGFALVRTPIEPTNIVSAWEKGSQEVLFQPYETEVCKGSVGYVSAARRRNGMPEFSRSEPTLEYATLLARTAAWIEMFNSQRIPSGQEMTPNQKFLSVPHTLRQIPLELTAQLAYAPEERSLSNQGVPLGGRVYKGSATIGRRGSMWISRLAGGEADLPVLIAWKRDDNGNFTDPSLLKPELTGPERAALVNHVSVSSRKREDMLARAKVIRAVRETTALVDRHGNVPDEPAATTRPAEATDQSAEDMPEPDAAVATAAELRPDLFAQAAGPTQTSPAGDTASTAQPPAPTSGATRRSAGKANATASAATPPTSPPRRRGRLTVEDTDLVAQMKAAAETVTPADADADTEDSA